MANRKETYAGPPEALTDYEAVVAGNVDVSRKGAKTPYTSRNGHMFSFLDEAGVMALRLSPEQRAEFIARYETHIVTQHGRLMKDFVAVPARLLRNTTELQEWFDASYAWTGTLKPKPTTRPARKETR